MNPWKLATIGISLVAVTALSTGVTTAYLMRPSAVPIPPPATVETPAMTAVEPAPPATPVRAVPARTPVAAPRPAQRVARVASPVVTAAAPASCESTGDRVWRIAKPGAVGGLIGAGLGAASGAIADGGKAAGKGALIGGIAGTLLGGGYGAYKTKQDCGTVLGGF